MFIKPKTPVARDRWGRPMIIQPDGKTIPYTRCTTYISVLDDRYNIEKWLQRMTAIGVATRDDYLQGVRAAAINPGENRDNLNELCEKAVEAAKGSAKATIGTALHTWIEQINLGVDVDPPTEFATHIENYRAATRQVHPIATEIMTVQDELQVGGTPDLLCTIDGEDGVFIADLKTGPNTLAFGFAGVAMQMAVYAHSQIYDPATGQRTPIENIRLDKGLVIALNSETGVCELFWIDLKLGWEGVQLATPVNAWRKQAKPGKKQLFLTPYTTPPAAAPPAAAPPAVVVAQQQPPVVDPLLQPATDDMALRLQINTAETLDRLTQLWVINRPAWTDTHTQLAVQRKQNLTKI